MQGDEDPRTLVDSPDIYVPSAPQAARMPLPPPPTDRVRRRVRTPLILFLLTCASTFWAGASIEPGIILSEALDSRSLLDVRRLILENYRDGLIYMTAVIGILLAHEMGHFVMTIVHRVPSSLPYFLPLPISFIGTIGAVIRMQGGMADRKQIFDIGLGGPIAGLFVALPVMWFGLQHLDLRTDNGAGLMLLEMPPAAVGILRMVGPETLRNQHAFALGHLQGNPLVLAGWFGFVVTGLNMIPVSQLDGGHVSYCLFGRSSRWIARALLVMVTIFIALNITERYMWILMVLMVLFLGEHPPTADDRVRIGSVRTILGLASLLIPILFLPAIPWKPA